MFKKSMPALFALFALVLYSLCSVVQPAKAATTTGAYVSWDASNATLSFTYGSYDDTDTNIKGLVNDKFNSPADRPWNLWANDIETITFDNTIFASYQPTYLNYWFADMPKLKTVSGIGKFIGWSSVIDISFLAQNDQSLTSLDLSIMSSSAPQNMSKAFENCSTLSEISLGSSFRFQNDSGLIFSQTKDGYWACGTNREKTEKPEENYTGWNKSLENTWARSVLYFGRCTCSIVLDANGGYYQGGQLTSFYGNVGESLFSVGWPAKPSGVGLTYRGYSLTRNGGEIISPSNVFAEGDVTYYAQWKEGGALAYLSPNGVLTLMYGSPSDVPANVGAWSLETSLSQFACMPLSLLDDSLASTVKKVVIEPSFALFPRIDYGQLFSGLSELTSVEGLENVAVKDGDTITTNDLFKGDSKLSAIDASAFKLDLVGMGASSGSFSILYNHDMFSNCVNLQSLDISGWYSSYTAYMPNKAVDVFSGCTALSKLVMTDSASYVLNFPVSSEWVAYYHGQPVSGADFSTQDGANAYFATHPGVSSLVKQDHSMITQFQANGGVFEDGSFEANMASGFDAEHIRVPKNNPSRPGYTFLGWADTPEASEPSLDTNSLPNSVDAKVVYYAVWQASDKQGWYYSDSGWQYYVSGDAVTGWLWIDDTYGAHWYYFNEDTYMAASQWVWDEEYSSWYWLCSSGPMIQGLWQWIDNEWYGFWWNGKMCRGWVWDNAWQAWFYCYNNGVMARNTWEGPYWLNWQGIWIR